ncbi:MAG TPA: hypothetical protein VMT16_00955 [Thermoanaerobaculia bacterium]|nr:hypothetical protein [Thermoanaerobaculia bacterium]
MTPPPLGGIADPGEVALLATKVAALRRSSAFPGRPRRVRAVETHMSWVFLAGDRAFKLKKPVVYPYLDFASVESRRLDARREVRLNRRLAPGVYLGVTPLVCDVRGRLRVRGEGEVVDWLVEMRRLPGELALDRKIRNGTLTEEQVRGLAQVLTVFYRHAPPLSVDPLRYLQRFSRDVRSILAELEPVPELPRELVVALGGSLLDFISGRGRRLLEARARDQRIREGHGDLRPEHVFLLDPPVILDCLATDRDLRSLDPAEELAFLSLECDALGAPWVRPLLLGVYGEATGDAPPPPLLSFYTGYRSFLRARLAYWHVPEVEGEEIERWAERARGYLELAAGALIGLG